MICVIADEIRPVNACASGAVTAVDAQTGYASGQEAIAHIGLGKMNVCDVEVVLPHGKGRIERKGVKANQRLNMESQTRNSE